MVDYAEQLQQRFPYDPDSATGAPHVIRTGETVFLPLIDDAVVAEMDIPEGADEVIAELEVASVIIVPLVKHDRIHGAMQFVRSRRSRMYTDDDVELARAIAARIAASIQNVRLQERQRVIAHTLQRSLLPASLPDIDGADVAVRYWPVGEANDVGGDFYDVFPIESGHRWGIVVGDVCGTGPQAAALTGLARHTIRDSAWHGDQPCDVLASLNRAVHESTTSSFLTAAYAVLDRSASGLELTVACGGHPLPIRVDRHGAAPVGRPGTLLGPFTDARVHAESVSLAVGDVVVFYTDGATDVRPPYALDELELTRIVEVAVRSGHTAEAIADGLRDALARVLAFEDRDDDIALLVLRVTDPSQV
jgi:serine phosphatase RsbU (regulator of sigma subunit)